MQKNFKVSIIKALIILVPSYTMAVLTEKMVYVLPMLAAASFVAASMDNSKVERKVEEDGYRMDDG